MAYTGGIYLDMAMNVAGIASDIGKIEKRFGQFEKKIGSVFKGLGGIIAGAISVDAIESLYKSTLEAGHQLESMSQKFGISAEQLSMFGVSARLTGTGIDSLGQGLKFLAKSSVEASKPGTEMNDTFRKMGVDVRDAATGGIKPMTVLMYELADAFSKWQDSPEKTALAVKVLERAGQEMIPFFNLGSEAMKRNEEDARELGAVWSNDTALAAAELMDSTHRLGFVMDAIGITIVKETAPAFTKITEAVIAWAKETEFAQNVGSGIANAFKLIAGVGAAMVFIFREAGSVIAGVSLSLADWVSGVAKMIAFDFSGAQQDWNKAGGAWGAMTEQMGVDAGKYESIMTSVFGKTEAAAKRAANIKGTAPVTGDKKRLDELAELYRKYITERDVASALEVDKELIRINAWYDENMEKLKKLGAGKREEDALYAAYSAKYDKAAQDRKDKLFSDIYAQDRADWSEAMGAEIGKFGEATDTATLSIADYNAAMNVMLKEGDAAGALRVMDERLLQQNLLVSEATDSVRLYEEVWRYANTSVTGQLTQVAEAGFKAMQGLENVITDTVMTGTLKFRDFANSVISDMIRIAVRASIVAPLTKGLMGMLGIGAPAPPSTAPYYGGFGGGFASGGPVSAGTSYLVGERGPELFVPGSSGSIVPNGGGGPGNVTVNIRNEGGQPVQAKSARASFDGQGMIVDVVIDAINRNVHGLRSVLGGA